MTGTTGSGLRQSWLVNLLACLLLMVASGHLSIQLGQDASFDLKNYHWYNAYAFLNDRLGHDIAPAMLQSFLNPLIELPYFLVATHLPDYPAYAPFLLGSYYGVLVFFLAKLAWRLFPEHPANCHPGLSIKDNGQAIAIWLRLPHGALRLLAALAVGATGTATLSQFGTTSNEIQVSVLVVAGLYFLVSALSPGHSVRRTVLAGGLIGAAAGLKLTAMPYVLGAAAAFALACWQNGTLRQQYLPFLYMLVAAIVLFQGSWSLHLYLAYGNPLFPFFNQIFASDWWDIRPLVTANFFPRDPLQWLFYPFYWLKQNYWLVMDGGFRDGRIAVAFLALVAIVPVLWRRTLREALDDRLPWHLIVVFFLVSYMVWLITFSTYRYLVPLEVLSGILLVGPARWYPTRKRVLPVILVLSCVIMAWSKYPDYGHIAISRGSVAAEAPRIPPGSLILLVGGDPMSYVASSFPTNARFVGIGNNFLVPGMHNRLQKSVDTTITNHRGAVYMIEGVRADRQQHDAYLAHYDLMRGPCQPLPTTLESSPLRFCQTIWRDARQ